MTKATSKCWLILTVLLLLCTPWLMGAATAQAQVTDATSLEAHEGVSQHLGDAYDLRLAGLFVDGVDVDAIEFFYSTENMWLPFPEVTDHLQVAWTGEANKLRLISPGGEATIGVDLILYYEGRLYISSKALSDSLSVGLAFNDSEYSVEITLPWWKSQKVRTAAVAKPLIPDFEPAPFSVNALRLDQQAAGGDARDTDYFTELSGAGRLLDGTWRFDLNKRPGASVTPQEYFWIAAENNAQWMIGNQTTSAHPLLPFSEFTGVQGAWSNEAFQNSSYEDITRNNFTRSLGVPVRDITGVAEPGSFAELVIEGRSAGFTRTRLDGTYEFLDVQLPSSQFNRIEVRVRRSASGAVIETQDYSNVNSALLLSEGRHLLYAGAGVKGDPLHPTLADNTEPGGLLQWRYGISDRMTLELLQQDISENGYSLVGLTAGFGNNWLASLSLAAGSNGAQAYLAELTGFGDDWQLRARSRTYDPQFLSSNTLAEQYTHEIDARHVLTDQITWGVIGRNEQIGELETRFLKPGIQWRPVNNVGFSLWPNYEGNYRLDANAFMGPKGRVSYSYEDRRQEADYRFDLTDNHIYYASVREFEDSATRFESGVLWYPDRGDNRSQVSAALLANSDGNYGYSIQADWNLLPGIFSRLELRDEPLDLSDMSGGFRFMVTITAEYAFSSWRPRPATAGRTFNRTGSISGTIRLPEGARPGEPIERVSLQMNGTSHEAAMSGGYFSIAGIEPGIYQVRLDNEFLPLEVVAANDIPVVKISSGAVTNLVLDAIVEYSIAGRVSNPDGSPAAGARVTVEHPDGSTDRYMTDLHGLYRADKLTPGQYRISAAIKQDGLVYVSETSVIGVQDFLFGQDLQLSQNSKAWPSDKG